MFAAEEHAVGIDGHRAPPIFEARLLDVLRDRYTGIVDEHIEPSVLLFDRAEDG